MEDTPVTYHKKPFWQYFLIYLSVGGLIYLLIYYGFLKKEGRANPYPAATTTGINPTPTPTPSPPITETEFITLTKDGFDPSVLTIKAGTKVTWLNQSGADATVNSSPHPLHTDYSPLNLGSFANNESVSLVFDKPGTYKYHDHLNPTRFGQIVVQ